MTSIARLPATVGAALIMFVLGLCACASGRAQASAADTNVRIDRYILTLEPDLAAKAIHGRVRIHATPTTANSAVLSLDAGALQIDTVESDGKPLPHETSDGRLTLHLPNDATGIRERDIDIAYHGAPKDGIHFLEEPRQIYTEFSTSQWMPCIDAPDRRAAFELNLVLPHGLKVVANGVHVSDTVRDDGKFVSRWRQERPMPSYLYGFAAGDFREVLDTGARPALRYLAPREFTEDEMRRIFRDTADMVRFYEDKSGVAYPYAVYTQVLVKGSAAQEMDGFAVMGERYGRRVLADASKTWLAAHELSHQWWGNSVTNRAWTEFWLNEGVASYLNAAWIEHHAGRDEYLRQVDDAREQYEKLRAAGKDKPLVFADWNHPTPEDRSLVYDKGAYVIYRLREEIGDDAFWRGLRAYTRRHWGEAVTSDDLQAAMEHAAGRSLAAFFAEWVHSARPALPPAAGR